MRSECPLMLDKIMIRIIYSCERGEGVWVAVGVIITLFAL